MTGGVRVELLGPVALSVGDEPIALKGARQRALLAALALDAGRTVPSPTLMARIWGDDEPLSADNALQVHVSQLRKILPSDTLVTEPGGYRLAGADTDVDDFDELITAGRAHLEAGRAVEADATLARALGLWRGDALADVPAFDADRARLGEARLAATEDAIEARLAAGRDDGLVGELEGLTAAHPYRERLWAHLMIALYRRGQQAAALQAFQRARQLLVDDLGIEPSPHLRAVEEAILLQHPLLEVGPTPPERPRHNLPAVPEPVGRDEIVTALASAARDQAVTTLTGPGGVGKTTVAVAAAHQLAPRMAGGAWFVSLAAIDHGEVIAQAIAHALPNAERGMHPLLAIAAAVGNTPTLVVLDTCEHLVNECRELIGELAPEAPGLRVLATSRQPLGVDGEAVLAVAPLTGDDSAELFRRRAAQVKDDFELTDANRPTVVEICRRLDCLPLAIELAAARVDVMTTRELALRLDDRFRALGPGPDGASSALAASIEWSHALLDQRERRIFEELGVFEGGFTAEAAAAVATDDDTVAALHALVSHNLVALDDDGRSQPRYRLLDSIRAFAREALRTSGGTAGARTRHLEWVRALVVALGPETTGPDHAAVNDRLELEHPNIRRALDWALEHDPESSVVIAANLHRFWTDHGHVEEGCRWLARAALEAREPTLARVDCLVQAAAAQDDPDVFLADALATAKASGDPDAICEALVGYAHHHIEFDSVENVATALEEASALEGVSDRRRARLLHNRAKITLLSGDLTAGLDLADQAIALALATGNEVLATGIVTEFVSAWPVAGREPPAAVQAVRERMERRNFGTFSLRLMRTRAMELWFSGDLAGAEALYRRAIEKLGELGRSVEQASAMSDLAELLAQQGEIAEARRLAEEGLDLMRAGSTDDQFAGLTQVARVNLIIGDANRVLSATAELRELLSADAVAGNQATLRTLEAAARHALGESERARELLDEAIALAPGLMPPSRRRLDVLLRIESDAAAARPAVLELLGLPVPERAHVAEVLELGAYACARLGHVHPAAEALAAAAADRKALGLPLMPGPGLVRHRAEAIVGELGPAAAPTVDDALATVTKALA